MEKSESINELATALSIAQSQIQPAEKDRENPFFKSRYATLASVWDAARKPLTDNGLAIVQVINDKELKTILMHKSGQWISGSMPIVTAKNDMQAIGSAISYAKRYSILAMVGITDDDDDDGNKATGKDSGDNSKQESKSSNGSGPLPNGNPTQKGTVTEAQLKRLFAIKGKVKMPDDELKRRIAAFGVESTKNLTRKQYDELVSGVEAWRGA